MDLAYLSDFLSFLFNIPHEDYLVQLNVEKYETAEEKIIGEAMEQEMVMITRRINRNQLSSVAEEKDGNRESVIATKKMLLITMNVKGRRESL